MVKGSKRKFGGKVYTESEIRYTKSDARDTAEEHRKGGRLARITKSGKMYIIWVR